MSPREEEFIREHQETFDLAKKELRGLTYGKIATMLLVGVSGIWAVLHSYNGIMNEFYSIKQANSSQDEQIHFIKSIQIPEIKDELKYQTVQIDNLRNQQKK